MKIIYRAYILLLVVLLATTFFFKGATFDIHIHDTVFVIAHFHTGLALSFYVLLLTIADYWTSNHRNKISLFQWLLFLTVVLASFWILYASIFQSTRYYNRTDINTGYNFRQLQKMNEITTIFLFFFVLTHLSFWIYFLVFLLRKFIFLKVD